MRRDARADTNQKEITKMLRLLGCNVEPLHMVGRGCPDLLVAYHGVNVLVEVKDGAKSKSKQALTPAEMDWHAAWGGLVYIVTSSDDAIAMLEDIDRAIALGLRL